MASRRKRAHDQDDASPEGAGGQAPREPAAASGSDDAEELVRARLDNARRQRAFWDVFDACRVLVPKAVIWIVFFSLFAMLRDFFALIFVTFVLVFLGTSATQGLSRWLPGAGWKLRSSCVFATSLVLLGLLTWQLVPQAEAGVSLMQRTVQELPDRWVNEIDPWLYENVGLYRELVAQPDAEPPQPDALGASPPRRALWEVERVRAALDDLAQRSIEVLPALVTELVTGMGAVLSLGFLSILFAFLIVLDLQGLGADVRRLDETRLHGFYRETVRDIVVFGSVLGKVLEAQAVIAAVNAVLTGAGLWLLGLPNVGFLSLLVFVTGFVPVAGVFLSSLPIALVALTVGGPKTLLLFLLFVTLVHFVEAYLLNPRIMGAKLKINPVLVLVILVIGHHLMGAWGLLLGLPVCYYFFTHVIKRERPDIGLSVKYRPVRKGPARKAEAG